MSEKSNLYVKKVIGRQMGHCEDLTVTPFKNTVSSTDNLFEDLGCEMHDLSEIALQIGDDLEADLYEEITNAETVDDIEKAVEAINKPDSRFEDLLKTFEPPKKEEEKKEDLQVEQTA